MKGIEVDFASKARGDLIVVALQAPSRFAQGPGVILAPRMAIHKPNKSSDALFGTIWIHLATI